MRMYPEMLTYSNMMKGKGADREFCLQREYLQPVKRLWAGGGGSYWEKGWGALSEEQKESEGCHFGWRLWVLE